MRRLFLVVMVLGVFLSGPVLLSAWDSQPAWWKVIPEVIWAPATGGGTWQTEVQITAVGVAPVTIYVYFAGAGTGLRGPFVLTTLPGTGGTIRYTNLLSTMDGLDAGLDYYGRSGAVWFRTPNDSYNMQVTAFTRNGNYGKTYPGQTPDITGTSCAEGRPMIIQSLYKGAVRRTFIGVFNTSHAATYVANFYIVNNAGPTVGVFQKTLPPFAFMAFNPFDEAGITATYTSAICFVQVISGGSSARGLMLFGAVTNNTTNDPAAVIPYHWSKET